MKLSTGKVIPSDVIQGLVESIVRENMFNEDLEDSEKIIMETSLEEYHVTKEEWDEILSAIHNHCEGLCANANNHITKMIQTWWKSVNHD